MSDFFFPFSDVFPQISDGVVNLFVFLSKKKKVDDSSE